VKKDKAAEELPGKNTELSFQPLPPPLRFIRLAMTFVTRFLQNVRTQDICTTQLWDGENNYWATPLKQHNYNQKYPWGDSNARHAV